MKPSTVFRPEVQGLRTIAVLGVVLFHLWPNRLTGGYVGVDVFFVISGFLITEHLLRERAATGRIALSSFYARRIRRLLPAALLVLAATAVGVIALAPTSLTRPFLTEVGASALYVENWLLAVNSVDYFASEAAASPVQHYWSLSVEEQFYLVWPLLLLAAFWIAGKRGAHTGRVVGVALGALFIASLAYSVIVTDRSPSFAYFATPAHAWEFAAGGLLAIVATRLDHPAWMQRTALRAAISWAGLAAIGLSMVWFDGETPFPGSLALVPVLGTLAVIAARSSSAIWAPSRLLDVRPTQFIGDVSYSLYLWHWPLIVLLPMLTGRPLGTIDKLVILASTIVLAWLTRRYVEVPIIRWKGVSRRRYSYAFAAVGSAAVLALCAMPIQHLDREARQVEASFAASLEVSDECFGGSALATDPDECAYRLNLDPQLDYEPRPARDEYAALASATLSPTSQEDPCTRGSFDSWDCAWGPDNAEAVIVLVGDSHAEHLSPALAYQIEEHDWQVRTITKRSCPIVVADWSASEETENKENADACRTWRERTIDRLASDPDVDVIVAANYTHRIGSEGDPADVDTLSDALSRTWNELGASGASVLVVADTPLSAKEFPETCVAEADGAPNCSAPRADALPEDAMRHSIDSGASTAELVDLTDAFCDDARCYGVIGGLGVYRDRHHLNPAFALSLAPWFTGPLEGALTAE